MKRTDLTWEQVEAMATVSGLPTGASEQWVRQGELARIMGVSTRTVRNWTREGA